MKMVVVTRGARSAVPAPPPSSLAAPQVLRGHTGPVYACGFSPDKQFLVSGAEDGTARLWSLRLQANLARFRGHHAPIWVRCRAMPCDAA